MNWLPIDDSLPNDGEKVVGMRNDGYRQDIVKWLRIDDKQ